MTDLERALRELDVDWPATPGPRRGRERPDRDRAER